LRQKKLWHGKNNIMTNKSVFFDGRRPGLPDFSWFNIPKRGKYTKSPQNIPNGHKMYAKWLEN
jgi:hypothetical protein